MKFKRNTAVGVLALITSSLLVSCSQKPTYQVEFPLNGSSSASSQSLLSLSSLSSSYSSPSLSSEPALSLSNGSSSPTSVHIAVPFASQAPLLNWDPLHQEACEEAALILVQRYLNGQDITPEQMEEEIQKLVAWETGNGYKWDVTIGELLTIAEKNYQLHGRIIENVTAEDIRKELSNGHPVIAPTAGQLLGNPYFSGDGPPYHMIVIIGFDAKGFITNDVGTKRGKDYRYDEATLMNAIHDWNGSVETITSGAKRVLVIAK